MTLSRILLLLLAALCLVGAVYFYMIHLAAAAIGFGITILLCIVLAAVIKGKMSD